jgi:microcystin-dependent protein
MNRSNFNQTGGYPLKTERLQEMQTAYSIFNALGALAGDLTIISGCKLTGTTIGDGAVYIGGELYAFKAAAVTLTSTVVIIEEAVNRGFKNGGLKEVHTIRYATFGTAETSWPWTDFKRMDSLKSIQARLLPAGTNPQLYCGSVSTIPTGWQLCDGSNGTPNLKGQFIVGYDPDDADYNAIGMIGGSKKVSLTAANNGVHSHTYKQYELDQEVSRYGSGVRAINKYNTQTGSFTTEQSGSGTPHENRPPYYTLAYIIYIG